LLKLLQTLAVHHIDHKEYHESIYRRRPQGLLSQENIE
jgi:hypothetical protein